MAEYGEWTRKGAVLSDVTVVKEYGVSRQFIVVGIQAGKLEYRQGANWGNPYLRILRSQLEDYIRELIGGDHLSSVKNRAAVLKIDKEIAVLRKRLRELEARRGELREGARGS
jgi:ABC-type uncharacterized transport system auxiliary subunit